MTVLILLVANALPAAAQVYVANSLSNTVSVINTPDNTPGPTIPVGSSPTGVAITPNGQFVYVTNRTSGTMSKIDTASNTVVATITGLSSPQGVAVSADGVSVYVVANGSLSLVRYSVATNAVTGSFSLPPGTPVDVAITPNGQFAYVVDQSQNRCSLYPINLATNSVLTSTACASDSLIGAVGGSFPRAVAMRPDGQFVYDTAFSDGALQVVRVSDNSYSGGGCVGIPGCIFGGPIGVAISSDGHFAFTANSSQNSVSIFPLDPVSGLPTSLPTRVVLPSSPKRLGVTADGNRLYVTHDPGSVSVIDLKATPPAVIKTIAVGSFPLGIAVSPLASSGEPPPPPPPSPPVLNASLAAAPGTVTVGQTIIVTMNVSNTGGSAASDATASSLSTSGTGAVTKTSGPTPGPTTIGPAGSQAFTYTYSAGTAGTVTFSGTASGGGVTSPMATSNAVTIQAPATPPTLSVAPGSLGFTGEQGLADPSPQTLTIGNAGSGTLVWSAAASSANGRAWLRLNPSSGSAPPAALLAVSASTCGLVAGTYQGSVAVAATGAAASPQSIPVTLTVTPPGPPPGVPHVSLCADRPVYHSGDTVRLSASLRPGTASNTGDAYVFAQVPGTTGYVSLVSSQSGMALVFGPAPAPLFQNISLFDFVGEFYARAFDGSEPEGLYTATAVLVQPNSDPLVVANRIAVGTYTISFSH